MQTLLELKELNTIPNPHDHSAVIQGYKKKRLFRKRDDPYLVIEKIKLWPSRKGMLHGVRSIVRGGNMMTVITHCNKKVNVRCSRNGRLARWLRNKWYAEACPDCRVPSWKLQKYSQTKFIRVKKHDRRKTFLSYTKTTTS
jgi:pyrrolysyl-tRNA synthetase-like protein